MFYEANTINILNRVRSRIFPSEFDRAIQRWVQDEGDRFHRQVYELNSNSVVFDLGGYQGQWASDIYSRYRCKLYVFEPVPSFYTSIKSRFEGNPDICTFNYGLSTAAKRIQLSDGADGSSEFIESSNAVQVEIRDIESLLEELKIDQVDLIKINIEGGEYELLEGVLSKKLIEKFRNIQIQFHEVAPDSFDRMSEIQKKLSKTHELTYAYRPYVWENWKLKET